LKGLDPGTTALASITQWLDALQTALFKADDSGNAAMSKLLRAEKLYNAMTAPAPDGSRNPAAYVLVEKMAALTGSVITKTNFFIPTRMYYNGGSIATFTLFNTNGEVLQSGTLTERSNNVRQVNEDGKPGEQPAFYP
jgi:hypothetical protein